MKIFVGTCGFPKKREEIFKKLDVVEHQEVFYDLISLEKAERYGKEKPENFVYTAKAFQAITHSPNSPTWKKIKTKLIGELSKYGFMRPTEENLWAWNKSLEIYKLMKVKIVVFQSPPSFGYSEENYRAVRDFFSIIDRNDLMLAWEPRGSWNQGNNKNKLCRLMEESGIIHAVDIFRNLPCEESGNILYIRLHGVGGSEVNYKYKYTNDDLRKLREMIMKYSYREIYVLFNNVYMFDDAVRFKDLLKS